jgi:replicative DNA helicase
MPKDYLPTNVGAERFVLGSVLLDESFWPDVTAVLTSDDFSHGPHQKIFRRMADLHDRAEHIDRVTVATELKNYNEIDECGGLNYLVSLDDGLPRFPSIDAYVRMVQEMSIRRRGILAAQHVANRLALISEDSTEALIDAERMLSALGGERNKHGQWQTPADVVAAYPGGLQALVCPPRGGDGIPTPWPRLTEALAGLHEGDLFILAGRPGMGKTVAGMQMCYHAATKGYGAAVFSIEMTNPGLYKRLIASVAGIDVQRMRTGFLNQEDRRRAFAASSAIGDLPLWMDDTRARTVPAMTAALRRLVAQGKIPKLVLIDHVQLMVGLSRKSQDRRLEIEDISNSMKNLAKEFKVTVILLSQLNRGCDTRPGDHRPMLSDLRECGALEQDSDVVLFLFREEVYNPDREDLRGLAEFIIAKQRNGITGKRDMVFLKGQQRFEEREFDSGEVG